MSPISRVALAPDYTISQVIKGGWQLAGGHGPIDQAAALDDMRAYVARGVTTFDCADIYTGVEALIGQFRRQHPDLPVQVHTKYVPDRDRLPILRRADVAATIDRSRARLGMERLDLVQFHWWDYAVPGYVAAALTLQELQREGKIRFVSLTNFDTPRLAEILAAGVQVRTIQVQYSVLDQRPAKTLATLCRQNGIDLLAYGTLAGGFLSERWLGAPEPEHPLENRSLTKYKLIIDDWGGWDRFQALLAALAQVGARYGVGIGTVATRWSMQQPGVAAAIVGARDQSHLVATLQLGSFTLDAADLADLDAAIAAAPGLPGDVYDLERIPGGKHAGIMKYNLNRE
jgi:aryl-alcohol dehydrogenase-like predicted oxidoreductase